MENTSARKNRSRSRPTPSGKRTQITEHDIFGIFEPLSRHSLLTTKQLVAFDRRYASKTRNRLTDLFHESGEWLERMSEGIKLASHLSMDEMYRLGADAEDLLLARSILPSDEWTRAVRIGGNCKMPSRIIRLAHDHMASDVVLDIEIGARASPDTRFINHIDLIKAAPAKTQGLKNPLRIRVPSIPDAPEWIEPDALFGIDDRVYFLEADMGTESIEPVIKGKIRAYREIVAAYVIDKHFGIDNARVLFVTTNEKRKRNIMKAAASIAPSGRSRLFAFACRPDLADFMHAPAPTGRMFAEPWQRVGFEDLVLSEKRG